MSLELEIHFKNASYKCILKFILKFIHFKIHSVFSLNTTKKFKIKFFIIIKKKFKKIMNENKIIWNISNSERSSTLKTFVEHSYFLVITSRNCTWITMMLCSMSSNLNFFELTVRTHTSENIAQKYSIENMIFFHYQESISDTKASKSNIFEIWKKL